LVNDQKNEINNMKKNINVCSTKEQVAAAGLLSVLPYSAAAHVYVAIYKDKVDTIHIPHSDVYFVRAALEKRTGFYFPLDKVEASMKAEGWRDKKGKGRY
jgi:hypothetical protein